MNLHYSAFLALLVAGAAQGQWVNPRPAQPVRPALDENPIGKEHLMGSAKAAGDTIFDEDFANGLAGNNGVGAWTTAGANGSIWRRDVDGPLGAYSQTSQRINSTTVANGFMIFDGDSANSNLGTNPPTPLATFSQWDGYLVSPVLDLSATPNAHLDFQMRLRWCCSGTPGHFVDVSTDGGTTWPNRFNPRKEGHVTNADSGTYAVHINLAQAIAGNPSNVRFRFAWEASSADNNLSHYFWQIDDVAVTESPVNDLALRNTQFDDYFNDGNVFGGAAANLEYSIYPYSQLRELTLKSKILNDGVAAQPNVQLAVDVVNGGGTSVFTGNGTLPTIAPGVLDSLQIDGFTPAAGTTDTYTVTYTLSSDSTDARPADNTRGLSFKVNEFEYAYDLGSRNGRAGNTDAQGNPLEFSVGNIFFIENDATSYGVKIAIAANTAGQASPVGEQVQGTVYDGNLDPVAETDLHVITNGNLNNNGQNKFVTLPFLQPLQMNAGEEYFVSMQYFGGTAPVYAATSGLSATAGGLLLDPAENPPLFLVQGRPMVRLLFDPSVGIDEADFQNGVGLGQSFPNPAKDMVTIPYELRTGARVRMELRDVSGKLVRVLEEGNRAAGVQRLDVNVRDLNDGVYFYTLTAGDVRIAKRMTVVH
ncbi:MAG: T9SS type A sorting domain-containing protein [Flavobacteriales bacterium]|nr:T9SS type A sorting domain-containing protein [Flavobacteriales bacterium]